MLAGLWMGATPQYIQITGKIMIKPCVTCKWYVKSAALKIGVYIEPKCTRAGIAEFDPVFGVRIPSPCRLERSRSDAGAPCGWAGKLWEEAPKRVTLWEKIVKWFHVDRRPPLHDDLLIKKEDL